MPAMSSPETAPRGSRDAQYSIGIEEEPLAER